MTCKSGACPLPGRGTVQDKRLGKLGSRRNPNSKIQMLDKDTHLMETCGGGQVGDPWDMAGRGRPWPDAACKQWSNMTT